MKTLDRYAEVAKVVWFYFELAVIICVAIALAINLTTRP